MSEHTPGPWVVEEDASHFDGRSDGYKFLSGEEWHSFCRVVIRFEGSSSDYPEGLANLRLISSAPDMLEALRMSERALAAELEMRNGAEDVTDAGYEVPIAPALRAVRMAIVKAEGRA